MRTFRKILFFGDEQTLADRPNRKITLVAGDSQFHDDHPRLVLYRAPSEKVIQGPEDILELLRAEALSKMVQFQQEIQSRMDNIRS